MSLWGRFKRQVRQIIEEGRRGRTRYSKPSSSKLRKIRKRVYARDLGRCYYCQNHVPFHQSTLDHYVPRNCGGTFYYWNLVTCCKKCNKEKGGLHPGDHYMGALPLHERLRINWVSQDYIEGHK